MSQIIDKFPRSDHGFTPLHEAAENGHFDVCKYITDQTSDKNPRCLMGSTPLFGNNNEMYELANSPVAMPTGHIVLKRRRPYIWVPDSLPYHVIDETKLGRGELDWELATLQHEAGGASTMGSEPGERGFLVRAEGHSEHVFRESPVVWDRTHDSQRTAAADQQIQSTC